MQGNGTGVPIGTIITWPTADWQTDMKAAGGKPDHFLLCNGQSVDSTKYPKLAKIMSSIPDYQGLFLRGYGSQSYSQTNGSLYGITTTIYSSTNIGSIQGDGTRNISGSFICDDSVAARAGGNTTYPPNGAFYVSGFNYVDMTSEYNAEALGGYLNFDAGRQVPIADEIRPINTAVIYLIRAK